MQLGRIIFWQKCHDGSCRFVGTRLTSNLCPLTRIHFRPPGSNVFKIEHVLSLVKERNLVNVEQLAFKEKVGTEQYLTCHDFTLNSQGYNANFTVPFRGTLTYGQMCSGGAFKMPHRRLPRGAKVLTACQARAARAMLTLSVRALAKQAEISESTIRRAEEGYGVPVGVSVDSLYRLQAFFEGRGFAFTWLPEPGPGVAWHSYPAKPGHEGGAVTVE